MGALRCAHFINYGSMDSKDILRYKDDEDRCYGVAGMALAAFVFEYEKYLSSVSIDRRDIETIEFTPDFFITAPENISAKTSWQHTLNQYRIIMSMMISNVMCRSMVRQRKEVEKKLHDAMLTSLHDYTEQCQLEDDEAEDIFEQHFDYLNRAYHNSRMHAIARRVVNELSSRHTLYHSDLTDLLSQF